jgi:hypothetical protein
MNEQSQDDNKNFGECITKPIEDILPLEPADGIDVVKLRIHFASGDQLVRKFHLDETINSLHNFCQLLGFDKSKYQLFLEGVPKQYG